MDEHNRVAILMPDVDMAELSKMALEPLGYEIQIFNYSADCVAQLMQYQPDALVMGLGPYHHQSWQVLDSLAGNADAASMPIVAIVFSEGDAKKVADYPSVVQIIFAPYDLNRLVSAVKAALRRESSNGAKSETSKF